MSKYFRSMVATCCLSVLMGCGTADESNPPPADQNTDTSTDAETGTADSNEDTTAKSGLPDEELILGTWRSTSFEQAGKVDPMGAGGKTIFTKDRMWLHGLPFSYKVDSTKTPKQLGGQASAIYELDGDDLTICISTSSASPVPTDFTTSPGDNRTLIKYERVFPIDPQTPDADFDSSFQEAISMALQQLEEEKYVEFLKSQLPPEATQSMSDAQLEQMAEGLAIRKDTMIGLLRALQKIKPTMNDSETLATFDLTHVAIPGEMPAREAQYAKVDGMWRLQDR